MKPDWHKFPTCAAWWYSEPGKYWTNFVHFMDGCGDLWVGYGPWWGPWTPPSLPPDNQETTDAIFEARADGCQAEKPVREDGL